MRKHLPRYPKVVEPLPMAFQRIVDGQELQIGSYTWRIVVGQGHSNEHACLYCETLGVLVSGDQVIPSITSNVSVMPSEPEANPLRLWLESHERFLSLPEETLVLPAHKLPFTGLRTRLRELIEHHEERLTLVEEACIEPRTAMELLPVLFDRELDHAGVTMALGETLAHLHLLMERKRIERSLTVDNLNRYRTLNSAEADRHLSE
jgi:glyoxylase-like metal-dependent hydrolase (beta-lactamase superfamily II)